MAKLCAVHNVLPNIYTIYIELNIQIRQASVGKLNKCLTRKSVPSQRPCIKSFIFILMDRSPLRIINYTARISCYSLLPHEIGSNPVHLIQSRCNHVQVSNNKSIIDDQVCCHVPASLCNHRHMKM